MPDKTVLRPGSGAPILRKPDWLKLRVRCGANLSAVNEILERHALNTVCTEANCPNRMECYNKRTATFMILGAICTRNCAFCNVTPGRPENLDPDEPRRLALAAKEMGLRYVVVTSVTRDDLPDGGSGHFAAVIRELKARIPGVMVEVLIPDFQSDGEALRRVVQAEPDVLNHNLETVPRLYRDVRPRAVYHRSLKLLERAKAFSLPAPAGETRPSPAIAPSISPAEREDGSPSGTLGRLQTKSGIMVGLGETTEEVHEVLRDLRKADCDFLTIGQYLAPSKEHYPVAEYVDPAVFAGYRRYALSLGFRGVAAAPFVRSSYNAAEMTGRNAESGGCRDV